MNTKLHTKVKIVNTNSNWLNYSPGAASCIGISDTECSGSHWIQWNTPIDEYSVTDDQNESV